MYMGQRERGHKNEMASTILHFHNQFKKKNNTCKLFEGHITAIKTEGKQMRDFVYVGESCVSIK